VVKFLQGLPNLRTKAKFKMIKASLLKARQKGLRVIHFSIQSNHIHLLIESEGKQALGKGMQSFCTSLAKRINFQLGQRRGKVFRDRYFLHILKTLKEVKHALAYILQNFAKHTKRPNRFDPYCSLLCLALKDKIKLGLSRVNTHAGFADKKEREEFRDELNQLIAAPATWFLRTGWQRA